ncbi:hypothetical protein GY45DRAFT_450842 [Cubamyces sp. BRFM 1775]|nr:hypothetical protein GY45DRAFT_450842 [Cubamyces sp. BRFM 1775]
MFCNNAAYGFSASNCASSTASVITSGYSGIRASPSLDSRLSFKSYVPEPRCTAASSLLKLTKCRSFFRCTAAPICHEHVRMCIVSPQVRVDVVSKRSAPVYFFNHWVSQMRPCHSLSPKFSPRMQHEHIVWHTASPRVSTNESDMGNTLRPPKTVMMCFGNQGLGQCPCPTSTSLATKTVPRHMDLNPKMPRVAIGDWEGMHNVSL